MTQPYLGEAGAKPIWSFSSVAHRADSGELALVKAVLQSESTGERIELGETTVIGRLDDCDLVVRDSKISRKHAMIRRQDDGYRLYDLGSSNGCLLNGKRITSNEKLANGDRLRFGSHHYQFLAEDAASPIASSNFEDDDIMATIADIQTVPVTMLVSDIKGFTKLSERIPPEALAKSMGSWYHECNRVMADFGASIDKFIGDCVLAYWTGTSSKIRRQALLASKALIEATETIIDGQEEIFAEHDIHLQIGVGLHLGSVAQGAMSKGTFTLLGDAVNVTFRLESLTRTIGRDLIVSDDFVSGWDEGGGYFKAEGSHKIKGRVLPLKVYSVTSWPEV